MERQTPTYGLVQAQLLLDVSVCRFHCTKKKSVMHRQLDMNLMCTARKKKMELTSHLLISNLYDCLTTSIIQGLVFQKHCSIMIYLIRMVSMMMMTAFMDNPGPEFCHATLNLVLYVTNCLNSSPWSSTSNYSSLTLNNADGLRLHLSIHLIIL